MIFKMILKSFEFQCDFDFDFQITTSKMIWILILNHLYLGDLILILKSSTYDDFAHLWLCSEAMRSLFSQPVGRGFRGSGESRSTQPLTLFLREFPYPCEILLSLF